MDPLNLPVPVSSEDYVPPEDVLFEQVWDPSVVVPSPKGVDPPRDLAELVKEFAGVVSHDKVRETVACFKGGGRDVCCGTPFIMSPWRMYVPLFRHGATTRVLPGFVAGGALPALVVV